MKTLKALLLLVTVLLLSGCEFSVYKLPLPGGADVGDNPITVEVVFPDVLDLVPQSTVKVNDVTVGKVTEIDLENYQARVTMDLRDGLGLPDNTLAEIRQTSLLGEKFVSLAAPENPEGELSNGDVIGVESTNRNPEVEEVLGAMSLLLNGGGVAQLKTIASELNNALEGREDSARSVLNQIRVFARELDENKADIVDAIESLNRLAVTANQQTDDIERALDNLPAALRSLDRQRNDLVKMLQALNELGDVGTDVIRASKAATIDTLEQLQPVLTQLANTGDDFANAFHVFLTYPFVDEVVGRDPSVARNLHMGDYTNLSVQIDVRLGGDDTGTGGLPNLPTEECTQLGELPDDGPLPDLSELCKGAADAINKCLSNPTTQNCGDLPGAVVDEVCKGIALPGLCPDGGGGGDGDDGGPLPGLPELPLGSSNDSGGLLGGFGLNRPAFGESVPLTDLMDDYDPVLVGLLLPGVAQ